MSQTALPSATFPLPPPVASQPFADAHEDGKVYLNQIGLQFFTLLWAGVQGTGGVKPQADNNSANVGTLFGMTGDGTISSGGILTITRTQGTLFGYFATGTDGSHLTGTVNATQLRGRTVKNAAPNDGDTLVWVAANADWEPGVPCGRSFLVSALPTGIAPYSRAFATDATVTMAAGVGTTPVGGGGNKVPVYTTDGTAWLIG